MSNKRKSLNVSGGANTLFNYFSKSPKTMGTGTGPSSLPVTSPLASTSKPFQKITLAKRLIPDDEKIEKDKVDKIIDESKSPIVSQKSKRRRLLNICDDDSDEENSHTNSQGKLSETLTESPLSKVSVLDKQELKLPDQKTDSFVNQSFKEKLNTIKTDGVNFTDEDDNQLDAGLSDEPTVWAHNKLDFLKPANIKDKNGRRPNHPEYDPSTLYVPPAFLDKLTPGTRQWWELKSEHFDCVLFFKVGKFYELYHMDADIGVSELGFTYMRGEFAHSGFPEQSYDRMATSLIAKGYKVARVEQTETPDMMADRVKVQKKVTKFDKVVNREVCQVTNRGTQVFGQQVELTADHQPNYMLAIVEKISGDNIRFGICFIDTSIGEFHIGEFEDDKHCSRLLTLLSHHPPVLVLIERHGISPKLSQIFKQMLSNTLKEQLLPDSQFWTAEKTLKELLQTYYKEKELPDELKSMQSSDDHLGLTPNDDLRLALKAFGGSLYFLSKCLIDRQIVSLARYIPYCPPDCLTTDGDLEDLHVRIKNKFAKSNIINQHMILDSITLSNLKVVNDENALLNTLDHCCTRFGKRLLHQWVCSPSCVKSIIIERQKAVEELMAKHDMMAELRALLGPLPDLDRLLAQIHTFGDADRNKNHPDARAILFEQKSYNKKKIRDFIATLNGFESLTKIPKIMSDCTSPLLQKLSQLQPNGTYPDLLDELKFFKSAFDQLEALKEGVIAPGQGVDADYDEVENDIAEINDELKQYLKKQERHFGCRINYFGTDKKRYQLEIPESSAKRADSSYTLEGQRKGSKPVRRYHTAETKDFLKRMLKCEDQRNHILRDLARRIFEKFSNHYNLWKECITLTSILDVLSSLAVYGINQNQYCFPEFIDPENEQLEKPLIKIEEGLYPCKKVSDDFIPNGVTLGGSDAAIALLTGPNMGGKSTLMRQIGLLSIMSQMGCPIPANSCTMSIIDRIFTRLGAQDNIMAGHSTFLVELNETSAILKHATVNSLVLLDELGRGTATYDGTAIAAAVVNYLADIRCRTLFSTHYHSLVDNFNEDPRITLGHMACMVENEDNEDPTQETVIFLYKYSSGPCPKSYGFNAAKLAGMKRSIIRRAFELSKKVEATALKHKLFAEVLAANKDKLTVFDILQKMRSCSI